MDAAVVGLRPFTQIDSLILADRPVWDLRPLPGLVEGSRETISMASQAS
jgi:hypothetical protein